MLKLYIITFLTLTLSLKIIAQDEKKFELKVVREVNDEINIESFIEVSDSVLAFIEVLKERWGEEQDNNGIIEWNNVSIDSIEGKINVKLYHSILKIGDKFSITKTDPISKKTKHKEIRAIRMRFTQKQKDLLSSRILTDHIKRCLMDVYYEIISTENVSEDDD